jgi:glycosyltransferase involved in cell wall biosynthesis
MKVLFISNLFPDAENPNLGIYNAQLVKHLATLCEIRVLAPRPTKGFPPFWFPKKLNEREQDKVFAPLFVPSTYVPRVGSRFNHLLMARSLEPALQNIREKFPFDVVLSSWLYPDACATAELARRNKFPFVAIAQGSDVHQYLKMPMRRKIISATLSRASAIVARSEDLSKQLYEAGVEKRRLHVIYNGVDSRIFRPNHRSLVREALKFSDDAVILLFVGNFLPVKNPLLLVDAHAALRRRQLGKNHILVMVGEGPLVNAARHRASVLKTREHILFTGPIPTHEVARYMQAADLLCVPSDNEGIPNVILEALASGLRVVARKVGGIPEILTHEFLGKLVASDDPLAMANAIAEILNTISEPEQIASYARQFSWETTARHYFALLQASTESHPLKTIA